MVRRGNWLVTLIALVALATPAFAGSAEQKIALRAAATAAAAKVGAEVPSAPAVKERGLVRFNLVVGPPGPMDEVVGRTLTHAFDEVEGFTLTWPKEGIKSFVDLVFLEPVEDLEEGAEDPRYDRDTILELGSFQQAQAVLVARYEVEQDVGGGTRATIDLELWDGKTAERIWGATHTESLDLAVLAKIDDAIDAGRIEEALVQVEKALTSAPQWTAELELLRQKAETLREHAEQLALASGHLARSRVADAYGVIDGLFAQGDASVHAALGDMLNDVRAKLLAPVEALVAGKNAEGARAEIAGLQKAWPDDLDLKAALNRLKVRADAIGKAAVGATQKRAEEAQTNQTLLYALAGVLAALVLGLFVRGTLRQRARAGVRNRGLDELESMADQADRVKEALKKDGDVRARMLRELDRAEDALAEAHHKAQQAGKTEVARGVHDASQHLQELRRRVKLVQDGDPQDFLKGRLPKKNLEGLLAFVPAVAGQLQELGKEAMAAQDAVAAGGDPAKNLKLLGGLALQLQGKLAERDAFFRTIT